MLSTLLLPHFTYRRHCARSLVHAVSGKAGLGPMFDARNWRHFSTYAFRSFVCNVCGRSGKPFFDFPDLERRHSHRIGELRHQRREQQVALSDPEKSRVAISTVAYDVGFSSLAPFNRAFRDCTGKTPSEWRRTALIVFQRS